MKQMMFSKSFAAKIATMALFLGMAQGVSAQTFLISTPNSARFVMVTADGVNLRRLPDARSGKVMVWNSDAGSEETYSKLYYSDTEAKLYRANAATGAYVDVYHPAKNSYLPVPYTQKESKNGWYNVVATADEYAGNPGKANAKYAWLKSDFCKPIDENSDNATVGSLITIPRYKEWDAEHDRMGYGPEVAFTNIHKRDNGIRVMATPDGDNNSVRVCVPFLCNGYVLAARVSVEVVYAPNMKNGDFTGILEMQENDMGESEKVFKVYMKSNVDMLRKAAQNIESASAEIFEKLLSVVCPRGVIPTDEVYFLDTNNKRHEISYNASAAGSEKVYLTLPMSVRNKKK